MSDETTKPTSNLATQLWRGRFYTKLVEICDDEEQASGQTPSEIIGVIICYLADTIRAQTDPFTAHHQVEEALSTLVYDEDGTTEEIYTGDKKELN